MKFLFIYAAFAVSLCLAAPTTNEAQATKPSTVNGQAVSSLTRPSPINPDVHGDPKPAEHITKITDPKELAKIKREVQQQSTTAAAPLTPTVTPTKSTKQDVPHSQPEKQLRTSVGETRQKRQEAKKQDTKVSGTAIGTSTEAPKKPPATPARRRPTRSTQKPSTTSAPKKAATNSATNKAATSTAASTTKAAVAATTAAPNRRQKREDTNAKPTGNPSLLDVPLIYRDHNKQPQVQDNKEKNHDSADAANPNKREVETHQEQQQKPVGDLVKPQTLEHHIPETPKPNVAVKPAILPHIENGAQVRPAVQPPQLQNLPAPPQPQHLPAPPQPQHLPAPLQPQNLPVAPQPQHLPALRPQNLPAIGRPQTLPAINHALQSDADSRLAAAVAATTVHAAGKRDIPVPLVAKHKNPSGSSKDSSESDESSEESKEDNKDENKNKKDKHNKNDNDKNNKNDEKVEKLNENEQKDKVTAENDEKDHKAEQEKHENDSSSTTSTEHPVIRRHPVPVAELFGRAKQL